MRLSVTILLVLLLFANNAYCLTLLEEGSPGFVLGQLMGAGLVIYAIYRIFRPALRRNFPSVFKAGNSATPNTPVQNVVSYNAGNEITGNKTTGKYLDANEEKGYQALSKGIEYLDNDKYNEALPYLDEAINYGVGDAYLYRASCFSEFYFYPDAVDDITMAINLEPLNPEFYNLRSGFRINTGDYEGALADHQKAMQIAELDNELNHEKEMAAKTMGYSSLKDKFVKYYAMMEAIKPSLAVKGFNLKRRHS